MHTAVTPPAALPAELLATDYVALKRCNAHQPSHASPDSFPTPAAKLALLPLDWYAARKRQREPVSRQATTATSCEPLQLGQSVATAAAAEAAAEAAAAAMAAAGEALEAEWGGDGELLACSQTEPSAGGQAMASSIPIAAGAASRATTEAAATLAAAEAGVTAEPPPTKRHLAFAGPADATKG